jgi:hypothetical protein
MPQVGWLAVASCSLTSNLEFRTLPLFALSYGDGKAGLRPAKNRPAQKVSKRARLLNKCFGGFS